MRYDFTSSLLKDYEGEQLTRRINSAGVNRIVCDKAKETKYLEPNDNMLIEKDLEIDNSKPLLLSYGVAKNKELVKDGLTGLNNILATMRKIITTGQIRASSPDLSFSPDLAGYDTTLPYLSTSTVLFSHIGTSHWPMGLILDGKKLKERYGKIVDIDNTLCTLAADKNKNTTNPIMLRSVAEFQNVDDTNDHLYRITISGVSGPHGTSFFVSPETYGALYDLMLAWNANTEDVKPRQGNTNTDWATANQWRENPKNLVGSVTGIGGKLSGKSVPEDKRYGKWVCIGSAGYATPAVGRQLTKSDIAEFSPKIKQDWGVDLSDIDYLRNAVFGDLSEAEARIVIDTAKRLTRTQIKNKQELPLINVEGCIVAISLPSYLADPMAVYANYGRDELFARKFRKYGTQYLSADKSVMQEIANLYDALKGKGMLNRISFFNNRGEEDEEALRKVCYAHISEDTRKRLGSCCPQLNEDVDFKSVMAELQDDSDAHYDQATGLHKLSDGTVAEIEKTLRAKKSAGYGYQSPDIAFQKYFNSWIYESLLLKGETAKAYLTFVDKDRDSLRKTNSTNQADFVFKDSAAELLRGKRVEAKLYASNKNSYGTRSFHGAEFVVILGMDEPGIRLYYKDGEEYKPLDFTPTDAPDASEIISALGWRTDEPESERKSLQAASQLRDVIFDMMETASPDELRIALCKFRFNFGQAKSLPMYASGFTTNIAGKMAKANAAADVPTPEASEAEAQQIDASAVISD